MDKALKAGVMKKLLHLVVAANLLAYAMHAQILSGVLLGNGASGGGGGITFKQAAHSFFDNGGHSTYGFTPLSSTSLLCISGNGLSTSDTITAITDSHNGSWTRIDGVYDGSTDTIVFCVKNSTSSAITITPTLNPSPDLAIFVIVEFSGVNSTFPGTLGSHSNGTHTTGTGVDINTSGSVSASSGDVILVCSGNFAVGTWVVGATNPPGITMADQFGSGGTGNTGVAYAILGGSYSAVVGLNPGSVADQGGTIGFQLPH